MSKRYLDALDFVLDFVTNTITYQVGMVMQSLGAPVEYEGNPAYKGSFNAPLWCIRVWLCVPKTPTLYPVDVRVRETEQWAIAAFARGAADPAWGDAFNTVFELGGRKAAREFAIHTTTRKAG